MQKTLFAAALAAGLGVSGAAMAADLYSGGGMKDAPVIPVSTWTGFYFGVNTGLLWNANKDKLDATAVHDYSVFYSASAPTSESETSGGFGGGQIGYNWQSKRLIFGIETDLQRALAHDKAATSPAIASSFCCFSAGTAISKSELDWFGTVRGRLGYLLMPNTLVYATGGFAYGGGSDKLAILNTNDSANFDSQSVTSDKTLTGYTIGGGAEYAISPVWSIKAEYQYLDLGSTSLTASAVAQAEVDHADGALKVDHQYHTFRLGMNYHITPAYEPLK